MYDDLHRLKLLSWLHFRCSRLPSPPFSIWSPSHSSPSSWWPTSRVTSAACGQNRLLSNRRLRKIRRSSQNSSSSSGNLKQTMKPNSSSTQISLLFNLLVIPQACTHQLVRLKGSDDFLLCLKDLHHRLIRSLADSMDSFSYELDTLIPVLDFSFEKKIHFYCKIEVIDNRDVVVFLALFKMWFSPSLSGQWLALSLLFHFLFLFLTLLIFWRL